jgi:hypothetical protein
MRIRSAHVQKLKTGHEVHRGDELRDTPEFAKVLSTIGLET